jgi:hypothetical protein
MKRAAHATTFEPAKSQISAAMRAVAVEQAVPSLLVAENDKVLAEQSDRADRALACQFIHQRRRLPVIAHQLAGWCLRPDPGDQVILLLAHHGEDTFDRADVASLYPSGKSAVLFVY